MALSWTAFHLGGVHTALCAVPLVWCVPHRARDLGLFDPRESKGADTLSRLEHYLARPVQVILGLFGFINAGIPISGVGAGTSIVFVSLVAGKFLGVVAFTKAGQLFGLRMPDGMDNKSLLVISVAAGIGFTVALFVCTLAAPAGPLQDQLKMGALFSAFAAVLTVLLARGLRVRRIET
jgi:Na+:H+ antiporter, NhaA family